MAVAIALIIGLGLGAAAAIFTASQAAFMARLPFDQPDRLVHLWEVRAGTDERSPTSLPTLLDWRLRARSFSALEGYDPANFTVGAGDEARMLRGARVTPGFFRLLGVRMSAGRDLPPDGDASTVGVAIVSERFSRFREGPSALDQIITVNGVPHEIVGVLPNAFHFALLQDADVFVPLVADAQRRTDRFDRSIHVVGRIAGHVPLTAARAELSAVMTRLAGEYPEAYTGRTVGILPLRDALLGNMKPILLGLLAGVAILLLIMSANLALLMLTQYVDRTPELALRSALGAPRTHVLRQLLLEALCPALIGAVLAIVIGQIATHGLMAAIPEHVMIGMPYLMNVGLDAAGVGVIVALTTILAVTFGLGPAMLITKTWGLAGDVRMTAGRGHRVFRRALVAAQLALTVVLLVASGLLVMSFRNLVRRDLGFTNPAGLIAVRAPLSGPRFQEPLAQRQFYEALRAQSAALPGIRAAGLINEVPGGGGGGTAFEPMDRPVQRSVQPRAILRIVGGEYFATMGIPLRAGRVFDSRDRSDGLPVAVVSSRLARLLAADGTTLGRRLRLEATGQTEWEVVGVVSDVQVAALDADSPPVIYLSHLQASENRMMLVLRSDLGVASIANQIRAIVKTLDPGVPVYAITTLERQLSESRAVFSRRFPMILCGAFAVAALALTLVALYALCMHDVLTRKREFGIRIALGASPSSIRRLVLGDATLVSVLGVGTGVIVATLVSRSLHALLFGIAPTSWPVFAAVAAGVLAAAFVATLVPVLRAGSVNPSVVMREE